MICPNVSKEMVVDSNLKIDYFASKNTHQFHTGIAVLGIFFTLLLFLLLLFIVNSGYLQC